MRRGSFLIFLFALAVVGTVGAQVRVSAGGGVFAQAHFSPGSGSVTDSGPAVWGSVTLDLDRLVVGGALGVVAWGRGERPMALPLAEGLVGWKLDSSWTLDLVGPLLPGVVVAWNSEELWVEALPIPIDGLWVVSVVGYQHRF